MAQAKEIKLINSPQMVINLKGAFDCLITPRIATSVSENRLLLDVPFFFLVD